MNVGVPKQLDIAQVCYKNKFVHSLSNSMCVITDILQKISTYRAPPYMVIEGHWNRHGLNDYIWLPVIVLHIIPCSHYRTVSTMKPDMWIILSHRSTWRTLPSPCNFVNVVVLVKQCSIVAAHRLTCRTNVTTKSNSEEILRWITGHSHLRACCGTVQPLSALCFIPVLF